MNYLGITVKLFTPASRNLEPMALNNVVKTLNYALIESFWLAKYFHVNLGDQLQLIVSHNFAKKFVIFI